jgi:aspartate/methionine/tyrosine aminotransferase
LNPLGSSYTEEELKEFAQIAKENDLYLLHDITYKDFAREHFLVENYAPGQTLTIYSFSKIFGMAGLRIGAIISSEEVIDVVKSIIINDVGTNMIAQAGALAALKSKPEWIDRVRDTTFENQKIIKEAVDQCEGVFLPVYPSSANMMGIDLSGAGIDPEDMSSYLIEKKVFTRQGSYTSNTFGHNYLRVSYSIDPEKVKVFAREFVLAVEALRTK